MSVCVGVCVSGFSECVCVVLVSVCVGGGVCEWF